MAVQGAQEAMAVQGAQEAMAGGPCGRGLGPLGPAPTAGTLSIPPQISLGKSGGIRSPPGLDTQNSTWQDSRARQTGQDSPQEPEALLGWLGGWGFFWAWPGVRGPHRVPQRPPPFQRQGGRRLEWPPWPQQEEPPASDESPWTRQDMTWFFKMFLWAQQNRHTALLAVTCGLSTGLGLAAASGHESAPIRWDWVSGNPAGMSQRQSGGHESAAIRRALSQRRAGGHWVRGGPAGIESEAGRRALSQQRSGGVISRERRTWGSGNPGTRQPASGLGIAPAGGPNRARDQRTRGTRGDPAELPRIIRGLERDDERRLPCRETDRTQEQNKRLLKTKTKRGEWAPLTV